MVTLKTSEQVSLVVHAGEIYNRRIYQKRFSILITYLIILYKKILLLLNTSESISRVEILKNSARALVILLK